MALYDHLGIQNDISGTDSVYKCARDNYIGVPALIYSAEILVKQKPERSVIFLATTGEEEGMLGSYFLLKHSPVPVSVS